MLWLSLLLVSVSVLFLHPSARVNYFSSVKVGE